MKNLLLKTRQVSRLLMYVFITASTLLLATSCKKEPPPPVLKVITLASGLKGPVGLEVDKSGLVWVAQAGTGNNDGKVSVIYPDGKVSDVITNFASVINEGGGEADGPSHLLFNDGLLYILGTGGKMYKAVASTLKPGAPINASTLGVEDIGAFVLSKNLPTHESHPYNFTLGPNGSIYITDAAANAIVKREKNGVYSMVAGFPNIPNPLPIGGPTVEPVPTGIYYDGQDFLITTLRGFPFPPGKASIYKLSASGYVTEYQTGFTTLVDIAKGNSLGRLVLEHGAFGTTGWVPFSGKLLWATGTTQTVLTDKIDQPAGLKQADDHTWYVTSFGSNLVLKVTY